MKAARRRGEREGARGSRLPRGGRGEGKSGPQRNVCLPRAGAAGHPFAPRVSLRSGRGSEAPGEYLSGALERREGMALPPSTGARSRGTRSLLLAPSAMATTEPDRDVIAEGSLVYECVRESEDMRRFRVRDNTVGDLAGLLGAALVAIAAVVLAFEYRALGALRLASLAWLPLALGGLAFVLRRGLVQEETLLVVRGLGVQLSSRSWSGAESSRLIDSARVRAVILNEGFTMCQVIVYLAIVAEGDDDMILPFRVRPRRRRRWPSSLVLSSNLAPRPSPGAALSVAAPAAAAHVPQRPTPAPGERAGPGPALGRAVPRDARSVAEQGPSHAGGGLRHGGGPGGAPLPVLPRASGAGRFGHATLRPVGPPFVVVLPPTAAEALADSATRFSCGCFLCVRALARQGEGDPMWLFVVVGST